MEVYRQLWSGFIIFLVVLCEHCGYKLTPSNCQRGSEPRLFYPLSSTTPAITWTENWGSFKKKNPLDSGTRTHILCKCDASAIGSLQKDLFDCAQASQEEVAHFRKKPVTFSECSLWWDVFLFWRRLRLISYWQRCVELPDLSRFPPQDQVWKKPVTPVENGDQAAQTNTCEEIWIIFFFAALVFESLSLTRIKPFKT